LKVQKRRPDRTAGPLKLKLGKRISLGLIEEGEKREYRDYET
jgi:hypothetical protein